MAEKSGPRWWRRATDAYLLVLAAYITLQVTVGDAFWPVFVVDYSPPLLILPVPILLAIMLRQRRYLRSTILTVVLVVLIWPAVPRPAPQTTEDERMADAQLTVMTLNVGNGLAPPARLIAALRDSDADVIGLQELTVAQAEAIDADTALIEAYPYRALYGRGIPGKGLLSRFPISEVEHLSFDPDRPDLKAMVTIDDRPITVIVAHPLPPRLQTTGFHFTPVTQQHLSQLREAATTGAPTLLMGDFNMTERHQAYRDFAEAGLLDAFRTVTGDPGYTIPARLGGVKMIPFMRIDFIWHSSHFRAQAAWVGPDAGSDHLPVSARLTWLQVDTTDRE